jgi:hypothetical protein
VAHSVILLLGYRAGSAYFSPVIPAKAGIQNFDWQPFWMERTHWILAFAGMTMKLYPFDSKTL